MFIGNPVMNPPPPPALILTPNHPINLKYSVAKRLRGRYICNWWFGVLPDNLANLSLSNHNAHSFRAAYNNGTDELFGMCKSWRYRGCRGTGGSQNCKNLR